MTYLCSSLEHSVWFAAISNSLKTNISEIKQIFAISQYYRMQSLHPWKTILKKKSFCFFWKKFPLFLEWPSYLFIYLYQEKNVSHSNRPKEKKKIETKQTNMFYFFILSPSFIFHTLKCHFTPTSISLEIWTLNEMYQHANFEVLLKCQYF